MLRGLLKLVLVIVLLVAAAAFVLGYWGRGSFDSVTEPRPVATTGADAPQVDAERARQAGAEAGQKVAEGTERARQVGAEVGERAAVAADQAGRALRDGSLTAKIKAKMALDDHVKALDIDVDTNGTTVTVSGIVANTQQRDRALALARETEGVTQVVDRLQIRQ
jgi:osmotically-inducible protein OsmY